MNSEERRLSDKLDQLGLHRVKRLAERVHVEDASLVLISSYFDELVEKHQRAGVQPLVAFEYARAHCREFGRLLMEFSEHVSTDTNPPGAA